MAEQPTSNLRRSPVTAATIVGSFMLSIAFWAGKNVDWAMPDQALIWRGEVWRLLTSTLVHANILHLAFNLYWLAMFGTLIEGWIGSIKTLLLFVVLALASSAAEFLASGGGIGLSGVGYGCFGLLYAVGGTEKCPGFRLNPKVTQLFVGWFFLCMVMTLGRVMNVGNVAHGVGAVAGYALGRAILSTRTRTWLAAVVAGTLALSLATLYTPWRYEWWWERGNRMADARDTARSVECWKRAIDVAGDDEKVAELFLPLADRAARAGRLAEADALIERGVRVASHPENLRAWQAYFHWVAGDKDLAAQLLSKVRMVDLDEDLRASPEFVEFAEQAIRGRMLQTATRPKPD